MSLSDIDLSTVITVLHMPSARRLFIARTIETYAREHGFDAIAERAARLVFEEQQVLGIRAAYYRDRKGGRGDPVLVALDNRADRLLGAIFRDARDVSLTFEEGDPVRAEAEELCAELFPAGVAAFTQMPYVEQAAEMERLVSELEGRYAPHVVSLGMGLKVGELGRQTAAYVARLNARADDGQVDYAAFRAADLGGQRGLRALVAVIVGTFPDEEPEQVAHRSRLLLPLLQQQEAVRQHYRKRSAVPDIDPDTGEELPVSSAADADQPTASTAPEEQA